jgi:hypothetical protein
MIMTLGKFKMSPAACRIVGMETAKGRTVRER